MLASITSALASNPILTLFVVVGLGYLVGELSLFGFRFGVVGVLFVGLAVGSLNSSISVPEVIPTLGLIIFIYTIGIQSGPSFFDSFRKRGSRDAVFAFAVVAFGAVLTLALCYPAHISRPRAAGLFAGAMTNTPALAAARETLTHRAQAAGTPPDALRLLTDEPVVAYSIAYPLGVIGMLLSFALLRRIWKVKIVPPKEGSEIRLQNFSITNPSIIGHSLEDVMRPHHDPGFVISRIQQNGRIDIPRSSVVLSQGDVVAVVGEDDGLSRAEQLFGAPVDSHIELDRSQLDYRRVFVSRHTIAGKRICDLDLENQVGATVTRVRRGDVDFVPTPTTRLELGDRVRVITPRENFAAISSFFGDSIRGASETDFGSVAIGMVLGALLGMIPIPMPGGHILRLGMAGGPLLVSLILGRLERTGRISWAMPLSANLTLRHIGLLFFLAGVGIRAGYSFATTLRANGLRMLLIGGAVTFILSLVSLIVGYKMLKIPYDSLMGMLSGIQTQPACLAYAVRESNSDVPNIAYAAVYPIAMITKIIAGQLLT
jgi:putative transport protein